MCRNHIFSSPKCRKLFSSSNGPTPVGLGLSTFSKVFCQGATIAPGPKVPTVLADVLVGI